METQIFASKFNRKNDKVQERYVAMCLRQAYREGQRFLWFDFSIGEDVMFAAANNQFEKTHDEAAEELSFCSYELTKDDVIADDNKKYCIVPIVDAIKELEGMELSATYVIK